MTNFNQIQCSDDSDIKAMVGEYYTEFLKDKSDKFFFDKQKSQVKRNFLLTYQMLISNHYIDFMKDRKFLPQWDWRYIDSLKLRTYDKITCPICRESNTDIINPHVTFCGHVYCLYCIVRSIQMGKEKCPVCQDPCAFLDLKTIEIQNQNVPEKKDYIKFTLMKKFRQSFEITPVDAGNNSDSIKTFQKLFSSTAEDRNKVTENEINNLYDFQQSGDFPSDNPEALAALEKSFAFILTKNELYYNKGEIKEYIKQINLKNEIKISNQGELVYFYQESSGSQQFINPINCDYMFKQSERDQADKTLPNFPPYQIDVQIFDIEKYTQNTAMRKKFRPFSHIPNNMDIRVATIKMDEFLNEHLLDNYIQEIKVYTKEKRAEFYKKEAKTNRYQKEVEQKIAEKQEALYEQYINEAPPQQYTEKVEEFEKNKDDPNKYPDLKTFAPEMKEDPMIKKLREYEEGLWITKNSKKMSESDLAEDYPDLIEQDTEDNIGMDLNNITKKKSKKSKKKKTKNSVSLNYNE